MCSIGKSTFLSHYAYEVSCRTREVRVPYLKRFAPSSIATSSSQLQNLDSAKVYRVKYNINNQVSQTIYCFLSFSEVKITPSGNTIFCTSIKPCFYIKTKQVYFLSLFVQYMFWKRRTCQIYIVIASSQFLYENDRGNY